MRINLFTQQSVSQLAASTANSSTTVLSSSLKIGQTAKDAVVNLSIDAVTRSQAASLYSQFYPTREGFSADALALSTALPQSTSSSTGLFGEALAQDARQRLDSAYAYMAASGSPYDPASRDGVDTNSLFGSLDRRSLLAVAQNETGLFTDEEQFYAKSLMDKQRSNASGLYSGPDSVVAYYKPLDDYKQIQILAAGFLDNVSDEEKATSEWQMQRNKAAGFAPVKVQNTLDETMAKLMVAMGIR